MARFVLSLVLVIGSLLTPAVRAQSTVPPPASSFPPNTAGVAPIGASNGVQPTAAATPTNTAPTNPPPSTVVAPTSTTPTNNSPSTPAATTPVPGVAVPNSTVPNGTAPAANTFNGQWRSPTGETSASGNLPTNNGLTPLNDAPRQPLAKVTSGTGALPNQNGQVWREYDISPYTMRVTSTNRPEQAIIDWILRETGYEAWHSSVVSVLSADAKTLRVYHIPEIQSIVADVVDRFLKSEGQSQSVNVRIISVDGPSWRIRSQQALRPVPVQTQGIQAWLIAREDASLLGAELKKRTDFREHGSPQLFINSGQASVVSLLRPRPYVSDVVMRADAWPGFEAKSAQYDEGMSIEISPLGSLDGRSLDAVVKVSIDQLERLQALSVDVPSAVASRQRTKIEVPQVSQFRLHDRFRWPIDQVLLVSLGVVPLPSTVDAVTSGGFRLPDALGGGPDRGELLLFIESKPWQAGMQTTPTTTAPAAAAPTGIQAIPGMLPNLLPGVLPGSTPAPAQPAALTPPSILGGLPNVAPLAPSQPRY